MPIIHDPFTSMKTTEVYVTSETVTESTNSIDLQRLDQDGQCPRQPAAAVVKSAYTVTVSSAQHQSRFSHSEKAIAEGLPPISPPVLPVPGSIFSPNPQQSSTYHVRRYATMEANTAMKSYAKVAGLFFIALLVTWIPSSANRVYSVVHKEQVCLILEYLSAFVLPLQGFWNAVIYAMTSLNACQEAWDGIRNRKRASGIKQIAGILGREREHRGATRLQSTSGPKTAHDNESMTELAGRVSDRSWTGSAV